MNTRPGAQNRVGPSLDPAQFGNPPNANRPPLRPVPSDTQESVGAARSASIESDNRSAPEGHSPNAAQAHSDPFSAPPRPHTPFPGQAWAGSNQGSPNEPWLHPEDRPAYGYPTDPYLGHFPVDGEMNYASSPQGHMPSSGIPFENSVSPLHACLIALILLAGLAFGVGRWFWIDEKLDLASARKTAVAALPSNKDSNEQSSIQSSIDSVYIPSMPNSEQNMASNSLPAEQIPAPDRDTEKPDSSSTASANDQSTSLHKAEGLKEAKDSLSADGSFGKLQPDANGSAPSNVRPQKKQASRTTKPPPKLASAANKERVKEIDRVRTQAYSETSKDRIGERRPSSAKSSLGPRSEKRSSYRTSKVAQNTVTSAEYARCLRIDNIIRREQCKWSLCNNQWGKGACPSY